MTDHLLDLTREMDDIHREIQDNLGEITPELEARLDETGLALASKVDSCALYLNSLEAGAKGLKEFAKGVRRKAEIAENMRERMLKYCGIALGEKAAIEGEHFTLRRRKNPPKVVITDEDALRAMLPEAFRKDVTWHIEKSIVKAAITDEGVPVKGAHIEQTERIEIK